MYSYIIPEDKKDMYAQARAEDIEGSYKDLVEVCGRIRNKDAKWALGFLESAAEGIIPVLFKRHNKHLGHRHELCGARGRYPIKAAARVLKILRSAIANSAIKGLGEDLVIVHASANKKHSYPRLQPKGRRFSQEYATARVEIVLKEKVETPLEKRKERLEKMKKPKQKEAPNEAPKTVGKTIGKTVEKPVETTPDSPAQKAEQKAGHTAEQNADVKAEESEEKPKRKPSKKKEAPKQASPPGASQ